ncbi:MAG: sigma-70 family RNA polymerase sigma factor [Deltaproteobacteria bacterium]|nr:sigma-70 family RNA polymerase sigma factor [Deltaproteobacteria bacterium]
MKHPHLTVHTIKTGRPRTTPRAETRSPFAGHSLAPRDPRSRPAGALTGTLGDSPDALFLAVWPELSRQVTHRASRWKTLRTWLDDVVADVACHVLKQLRELRTLPRNVRAWLYTVTERRLMDLHRKLARRRRFEVESLDASLDSPAREFIDPKTRRCPSRAIDGRRARRDFEATMAHYLARADGLGQRGHHLRSWVETRVLERHAADVAADLARERGTPVSPTLVWKWSERGRRLLIELAQTDPSRTRGQWVRALVEGLP